MAMDTIDTLEESRMSHLQQYVDYLRNAGGSVTTEQFDDDWEPIGPMVRDQMLKKQVITQLGGRVYPRGTRDDLA